jgi:hypothetical protein
VHAHFDFFNSSTTKKWKAIERAEKEFSVTGLDGSKVVFNVLWDMAQAEKAAGAEGQVKDDASKKSKKDKKKL